MSRYTNSLRWSKRPKIVPAAFNRNKAGQPIR